MLVKSSQTISTPRKASPPKRKKLIVFRTLGPLTFGREAGSEFRDSVGRGRHPRWPALKLRVTS